MSGKAFVFINHWQAARFGHVGWGFTVNDELTRCYFGSTDHLCRHPWWDLAGWWRYAHLEPSADNDWWSSHDSFPEMMRSMSSPGGHHLWYQTVKEIDVAEANPRAAIETAESMKHAGWSIVINNCVHQTFQVLTAYGAALPEPASPITNLIPRRWFEKIQGRVIDLSCERATD